MSAPKLPTLPEFSSLSTESSFLEAANTLFETAPPLAKALWSNRQNLKSYEQLIKYAGEVNDKLSPAERIEVINAHPRIGAKPSESELSALSYLEQGLAGENKNHSQSEKQKLEAVYEQLGRLNTDYEQKFGFKFVVFVNGRSKAQIVPVIEERLHNSKEQELETGLRDMLLIAEDRLKKLRPVSKL